MTEYGTKNTFKTKASIQTSRTNILEDSESPDKLRERLQEMKDDVEKDVLDGMDRIETRFTRANERLVHNKELTQERARRRHDRIEKVKQNKAQLI